MADYIDLGSLKLNHFTVSDAQLYCQLSLINPNDIKILDLDNNKLTDILGINIFKNLEVLYLSDNKLTDISRISIFKNLKLLSLSGNLITDISFIKNLVNLNELRISNLSLTYESDTVNILKNLPNLNELYCKNTFKTVNIKKELKDIKIY